MDVDIQRIWCSEEVIERMTFEGWEDAAAQGIRVMEFFIGAAEIARVWPRESPRPE